jgi:hypothetical protein
MSDKYQISIKYPEWLKHSDPGTTISLFNAGRLPSSIAGWMLVVSLKHPLRAIYGSDVKAAWHLLLLALWNKWDNNTGLHIWLWRAMRLFRKSERDYWLAQGMTAEDLDRDVDFGEDVDSATGIDDERFENDMREAFAKSERKAVSDGE